MCFGNRVPGMGGSPDRGVGNSRSCSLGVPPNLGKLLEHPTGFQQPGSAREAPLQSESQHQLRH